MDRSLAPIVLFVYNRPEHTRKTLEALQRNQLAAESDLIIFSDGYKNTNDAETVQLVRVLVHNIKGFRSIKIVEREINYGLARNIIEGVTAICKQFGRVIVLEDDIVTSPNFLFFMNAALKHYENNHKVMHISASTYPVSDFCQNDTFFLKLPLCWGWATWNRAWVSFKKDISIMKKFNKTMRYHFNFNDNYDYWSQLKLNQSGKINTWFIFWYAVLTLNNGLALFPRKSLVDNIGFDGSGTHCGISEQYNTPICDVHIHIAEIPLCESKTAFHAHIEYFKTLRLNLFDRSIIKLLSFIKFKFLC